MSTTQMTASEAIQAAATDILGEVSVFNDRAFISEVWARLAPMNHGLSLAAFRQLCVELHFAGEISLSRCDLVEAHDARTVAASETEYDGSTFHFVRLDAA